MKFSYKLMLVVFACTQLFFSCKNDNSTSKNDNLFVTVDTESFPYMVEQFADLKILRYQLPGWENLT